MSTSFQKKSFTKILLVFLMALFLTACGGGGSSSSSSVSNKLDGSWSTGCIYDATLGSAEHSIYTISGGSYSRDVSSYTTSDCSGTASDKITLTANIDYVGEQVTSVCTAEKIDVRYEGLTFNGTTFTIEQLNDFLQAVGLNNPEYNIACVFSDKIWLGDYINGLDGSSADRRPTTIDLSLGGTRI